MKRVAQKKKKRVRKARSRRPKPPERRATDQAPPWTVEPLPKR